MTAIILQAFLPVFAVIALGYGVRASGLMPRPVWTGVNALNHRVLLPAVLFSLFARVDIFAAASVTLGLAAATGSLIMLALGIATGWALRLAKGERAALVSVAVLWNFVLTLALAERLLGAAAVAAAASMVAAGVLIGAVCAVGAFALARAGGRAEAGRRIATDPVVIACLAGLAVSAAGFAKAYPGMLVPLEMIGAGSIAVIMLAMGAGLDFTALKGRIGALIAAAGLRTLISPAVFLGAALLFGLSGDAAVLMALAGAAPGAAFTYAVAADFEGETGLVAGMITLSVLISALVLPLAAAVALSL